MGTLKIGRVGLDVDLDDPQEIGFRGSTDGRTITISGLFRADTLEETKVLRSEILAQVGQLIPLSYDTDSGLNGVAILEDANVDLSWRDGSLLRNGLFRFDVAVTYLGSFSEVEFQSLLAMVDAAEDHATAASFWHSPPVDAQAYSAGASAPTLITRPTADGEILFAYDIPEGTHPTWSVDPVDYYTGAVELWAGGYLRAGRDMPMDPTDWFITNGIMEIRPSTYQAASDGEIDVRFHDGTDWGAYTAFQVDWAGTNKITAWHYVTCIRNNAEAVTMRLVRDAAEDSETTARHELDITLRRGGALASFLYKFDGSAQAHGFGGVGSPASTRPGGTASYAQFDALVNGDRIVYGTPRAFTLDVGGIEIDVASQSMPFWIGASLADAADGTGNGAADLAQQYVGQVAEAVRGVRR